MGKWEQQGSEAGSSPVVPPQVGAWVRGMRGEVGGSERENMRRREKEGWRELQEILALKEARGAALEAKKGKINFTHRSKTATRI